MKNWYWAQTAEWPKFLGVDARAGIFFLVYILHATLWTFWLAVVAMAVFGVMSYYGLTLPVLFRRLRRRLGGKICVAQPWWLLNRYRRF